MLYHPHSLSIIVPTKTMSPLSGDYSSVYYFDFGNWLLSLNSSTIKTKLDPSIIEFHDFFDSLDALPSKIFVSKYVDKLNWPAHYIGYYTPVLFTECDRAATHIRLADYEHLRYMGVGYAFTSVVQSGVPFKDHKC